MAAEQLSGCHGDFGLMPVLRDISGCCIVVERTPCQANVSSFEVLFGKSYWCILVGEEGRKGK